MIKQTDMDRLAHQLRTVDDVQSIAQAEDLESAKKLCSASRSAKIVLFAHKHRLELPKDWLSSVQYCDQEYGILITEQQINRPRKGHYEDTLRNQIITALIGFSLSEESTPLRLKTAESISAPAPQSQFLLVFSNRTIISNT